MSNVRKPRVWSNPDVEAGPSFAERQQLERLKNLKSGGNKNYDSRFGSPVFKTTEIKKKRGFASRHPYFTIFAVSALTLASFWARPVYLMLTTKVTPEDEEKRRQINEMVSKQLAWTMPIRNTYAEYRKKKEPSQED